MAQRTESEDSEDVMISPNADHEEIDSVLQGLDECEDVATERVYTNLKFIFTVACDPERASYLAMQTADRPHLFESFWHGLIETFGSRFPEACRNPNRNEQKGIFSRSFSKKRFNKGTTFRYPEMLREEFPRWPTDEETQVAYISILSLACFYNITDRSEELCRKFGELGYLELILTALQSTLLLPDFVFSITGIIYNCCRKVSENRALCKGWITTLEGLTKSQDPHTQSNAFLSLSYIIDKADAHKIGLHKSCVQYLLNNLKEAMKDPQGRGSGFSIEELAQGIHQLAINDDNKRLIADKGGIRLLESVLINDNGKTEEKCFAAQGIWQLAFIESNKAKIRRRTKLMKALNLGKVQSTNADLRDACSGALFVINDLDKHIERQTSDDDAESTSSPQSEGHVMISYQHRDQGLMLKVKKDLEKNGYTVWMDVDRMRGDILDAMAQAVQSSTVVLVCMSLRFKESQHCRTEATYAYTLKKDIIPLLLQEGYVPEDWLGALLGMKKYFPMYSEEKLGVNLPELIKELGDRGRNEPGMVLPIAPSPINSELMAIEHETPSTPENDEADIAESSPRSHGAMEIKVTNQTLQWDITKVETWSAEQVCDWLKASGVKASNKSLNELTGIQLVHLFNCWCSAPEYCSSALNREFGLGLLDVAAFVTALKALFE